VEQARRTLDAAGVDWRSAIIEGRYSRIAAIQQESTTELAPACETLSDRIDRVVTHRIWGTVIFLGLMALMFQCIFSFAHIPMDLLQTGVDWLGATTGGMVPPGDLNSLLVNGVIAGVGAVVVFLPQILLLFLFIGFLEDTGYMARAAFLMDRLMSKVGLHGKSFIPMLSSFACAIPGIMATRTIESPKDRLVTILISPLMSCSARLPVYTILIAACIPDIRVLGFLKLPGLTLLGMYLLGVSMALLMAWVFKKTILKGEPPLLIMELPPYKRPLLKVVMRHMWDRVKVFLRQAGTIILGLNIILWFLAAYPQGNLEREYAARKAAVIAEAQASSDPVALAEAEQAVAKLNVEQSSEQLHQSFAGRLGRLVEPAIAPLGFDWKMGVGLVSSFAAREAFVSTMAIVYNVADDGNEADGHNNLVEALRAQKRPDGTPVYTTLTALTLMVFYVFALQCVSTVAIVRRETNTWKWPLFQWAYMGVLAWVFAFATYRIGLLLAGG
jgi:ferrous iron transport protein B